MSLMPQSLNFQLLVELKWNEDEDAFEIWSTGHVGSCDEGAVLFAYGTMAMGALCGCVVVVILLASISKALFFGAREITS